MKDLMKFHHSLLISIQASIQILFLLSLVFSLSLPFLNNKYMIFFNSLLDALKLLDSFKIYFQ